MISDDEYNEADNENCKDHNNEKLLSRLNKRRIMVKPTKQKTI